MTVFLARFRSHDGGGPAIEFGLILPIMIALVMLGVDGWMRLSHVQNAASALHAGARYYQQGGADDDEAVDVTLAAWANPSEDAEVTITRKTEGSPAQTLVTIKATSTFTGLRGSEQLSQEEVVRVQ
jgi:Flp pilus assembly protein TadG